MKRLSRRRRPVLPGGVFLRYDPGMESAQAERAFETAADATLHALENAIGELGLDLEVELQMGILSLEFPDGEKYIINSHRAARQIWMAAERTAWHFDASGEGRWTAQKTGDDLHKTIASVLTKKVGKAVTLEPSASR